MNSKVPLGSSPARQESSGARDELGDPPAVHGSCASPERRWLTGEQVMHGRSLEGRRTLVTGAASGLGYETARCLALGGADVTLVVRRADGGRTAAHRISQETGNPHVRSAAVDLADVASVRAFAAAWRGPLHVLVANAGVMALPERVLTAQGVELQLATNFLGHQVLLVGLRGALAVARGARVVVVSSAAHRASPVVFDDVSFTARPYDRFSAYGQSKTACALLAVHAAASWADDGVSANALHPGAIWTGLQRHTGEMRTPVHLRKTVAQGAATSVYLAASPLVEGVSGRYFEDCGESPVLSELPDYYAPGVMEWAVDPVAARRLWQLGEEWTAPAGR